ncbi:MULTISPECIES: hypothetical protein [Acinetobacter]|uniref:hypothetical protein n=1 Tax=Acinetobacter TaxID=469 RepID=UPI0003FDE95F|nr:MULTISPECIES: hypothetical protein [Acinetobacter]AIL78535.1 hypothetical protein IX87_07800 [Acinetobacter baumannii]AIL79054.1 hypothetical protein IX87_10565 [Acinetobacter baumannii]AIS07651.1 hypothetical protein LX00_15040 [Acinetobacter baumannii]ATD20136.1 hypothetical protein BS098_09660 [Acinetobacter baumannii]AVO89853.1 hypothetical protein AM480_02590 [Acinetobacter baumannii]
MKPEQFIREYGVEKAREVVEGIPSKYMECYYSTLCYCTKAKKYSDRFNPRIELVNMADLKRLVESIDLVESWGGIEDLKLYDLSHCKDKPESAGYKLLKAIADYESIYGGGDE